MSAELRHVVNGWLASLRGSDRPSGARDVAVTTSLGLPRSLHTAVTSLSPATVKSLQKKLRDAGFKNAKVESLLRGDGGGFTVEYQGREYKFWIEEAQMRNNGRGLYHDTGVGKNDMVLHQDHRGRWRIDLVTSASGNHTDVTGRGDGTGPNQGYSTAERAFEGALDEQRRRGLRGKTHVWIQKGDSYESYEPEGAHLPFERNGRRTGILSDGTRVNVYHQPGLLDEYTVVPHSEAWDSMERRGMRSMLALSATGAGFSEWTEGQEGRHLGRSVPWDAVPDVLKRQIERRVVQEASMSANPRKVTIESLKKARGSGRKLVCSGCGESYGADPSDYFWMKPDEPFVCGECGARRASATWAKAEGS